MRAFVAVELSEESRRQAADLEADLGLAGADVKWVKPENLHLTLKFLGELDEERLPSLTAALRKGLGRKRRLRRASVLRQCSANAWQRPNGLLSG